MSGKVLRCDRIVPFCEGQYQDYVKTITATQARSVADAFLAQVECGKDYIISTDKREERWADGLGTKYTYSIKIDEMVRCRDCEHARVQPWNAITRTGLWCVENDIPIDVDGFCAWGERGGA